MCWLLMTMAKKRHAAHHWPPWSRESVALNDKSSSGSHSLVCLHVSISRRIDDCPHSAPRFSRGLPLTAVGLPCSRCFYQTGSIEAALQGRAGGAAQKVLLCSCCLSSCCSSLDPRSSKPQRMPPSEVWHVALHSQTDI